MTKPLLVSLYAMRTQIDAVIAQVEEGMGISAALPSGCPVCKAPEDYQEDESTFGVKQVRCTKCGAEYEPAAVTA